MLHDVLDATASIKLQNESIQKMQKFFSKTCTLRMNSGKSKNNTGKLQEHCQTDTNTYKNIIQCLNNMRRHYFGHRWHGMHASSPSGMHKRTHSRMHSKQAVISAHLTNWLNARWCSIWYTNVTENTPYVPSHFHTCGWSHAPLIGTCYWSTNFTRVTTSVGFANAHGPRDLQHMVAQMSMVEMVLQIPWCLTETTGKGKLFEQISCKLTNR